MSEDHVPDEQREVGGGEREPQRLACDPDVDSTAGYRMEVDPTAIGLPVTAFVRIRPGPGQLPKIAEAARLTPQVVECHRVTGEDCFILKVHAPSVAELEETLDQFLAFGQTTTSIVVSTPVPLRAVSLPEPRRI